MKLITETNNRYSVDCMGNVFSHVTMGGNLTPIKCTLLKQQKTIHGYLTIDLSMERNKTKKFPIHRLVAKAYLDNVDNKPCVNHIDGDKLNNDVSNLEWCTYSENEKHSYTVLNKVAHNVKEINAYKDGVFIGSFFGARAAGEALGIKSFTNINYVTTGKRKTVGGYYFEWV